MGDRGRRLQRRQPFAARSGAAARSRCRGSHSNRSDLFTRPLEEKLCPSRIADRRVRPSRSRDDLPEGATFRHARRSTDAAIPGHDRRIRTGADSRTVAPRQAPSRQGRASLGFVCRTYGYRYIRKTSEALARYEIDAAEAEVVRLVYHKYTVVGLSIGAIARLLHGMGVPTVGGSAGNDRLLGDPGNRPIRARPASTRRRSARGKRRQSRSACRGGRSMGKRAAITNGPVTNGSKSRSRRLSAKRPSPWRQSGWLTTSASRPAGPSSPASSRG